MGECPDIEELRGRVWVCFLVLAVPLRNLLALKCSPRVHIMLRSELSYLSHSEALSDARVQASDRAGTSTVTVFVRVMVVVRVRVVVSRILARKGSRKWVTWGKLSNGERCDFWNGSCH